MIARKWSKANPERKESTRDWEKKKKKPAARIIAGDNDTEKVFPREKGMIPNSATGGD